MQKTIYKKTGKTIIIEGKSINSLMYMFYEIVIARGLMIRWFLRDFNAQYRQTLLGFLWVLIIPLFTVMVFILMRKSGVINAGKTQVPYPVFALSGLTIWSVFSTVLSKTSTSLINAGALMIKINFPKISIVIAAACLGLVDFIIKMIFLIIIILAYQVPIAIADIILTMCCLFPLFLFTTGMGMILSIAAGVFRDAVNIINLLLMPMMLFTPILYLPEPGSTLHSLNLFNPLNYFINMPREILFSIPVTSALGFCISSIISLIVFFFSWRLFYISQSKITERI